MQKKLNKAQLVAYYSLMFALIFVATLLDRALSWAFLISAAVCVVLVAFSICFLFNRWDCGVLAGFFWGLASWLKEFIFPTPSAPYIVNGIVPIVPRVLAAFLAFCVYKLMLLVTQKFKSHYTRQTVAMTVALFVGLVANTVLFLTALNTCKNIFGVEHDALFEVIKIVLYTNILPEYLISLLLVPHIVIGVRRGLQIGAVNK